METGGQASSTRSPPKARITMKIEKESETERKYSPIKWNPNMRINTFAGTIFGVLLILAILGALLLDSLGVGDLFIGIYVTLIVLLGLYILFGLQIASQWEKAVVLRLGKFHKLCGPGLFWIIPIVDATAIWIDHRVMVTPFSAEKTLTKVVT
jgi:hypothetical protein